MNNDAEAKDTLRRGIKSVVDLQQLRYAVTAKRQRAYLSLGLKISSDLIKAMLGISITTHPLFS